MSFLLDTNVLSELRRPNANPGVRRWFEGVGAEELFVSVLVLGEIRRGVEGLRRRDALQGRVFETWLDALRVHYSDRILPISGEVAEEWGRLNVPDPLPAIDGLIAATARLHRLTLVTRDAADFARAGVTLLNPFS